MRSEAFVVYRRTVAWTVQCRAAREPTQYYVNPFKKLAATPEWKSYPGKNALKENFLTGKGLTDYLGKDEQNHREIMKAAGFLAK